MDSKLLSFIIHPGIEAGVIDNKMLTDAILEQGPTEEAGRLYREEGVHFGEVKKIFLEFKKIIRIDHLWMLKNLTKLTLSHNLIEKIENIDMLVTLIELDLSFNKIEKIENMDTLVNIENLTLYHNKIRKLENMDTMEKLLILSIGDNLIEEFKELGYLRRFQNLRSLSINGNQCCNDPMHRIYIQAALPDVTYLDYIKTDDESREEGRVFFRGAIKLLDDEFELYFKNKAKLKEKEDQMLVYKEALIDSVIDDTLFDKMLQRDPEGSTFIKSFEIALPDIEIYKEKLSSLLSELIEPAVENIKAREDEVKMYKECISTAIDSSSQNSVVFVDQYYVNKGPLFSELRSMIASVKSQTTEVAELEERLIVMVEEFNAMLQNLWKILMADEMITYERCEVPREQFEVNLTQVVDVFVKVVRATFDRWRQLDTKWIQKQLAHIDRQLEEKNKSGLNIADLIAAEDMKGLVEDSRVNHRMFIDEMEDVVLNKVTFVRDSLIKNINKTEIKRNRDRIIEINYMIDNQREEWSDLQMQLADVPDPDALGIFDD